MGQAVQSEKKYYSDLAMGQTGQLSNKFVKKKRFVLKFAS